MSLGESDVDLSVVQLRTDQRRAVGPAHQIEGRGSPAVGTPAVCWSNHGHGLGVLSWAAGGVPMAEGRGGVWIVLVGSSYSLVVGRLGRRAAGIRSHGIIRDGGSPAMVEDFRRRPRGCHCRHRVRCRHAGVI